MIKSKYWFRTRYIKNTTIQYTSISTERRNGYSIHCQCESCYNNFNRNTKAIKYNFVLCDICSIKKYGSDRFTKEVREKISKKVSAAYSNLQIRKNKSIATIKAYQNPINKEKQRIGSQQRSLDPSYRQKLRDNAERGSLHAIKTSCGQQRIEIKDFNGFITGLDIREREKCKATVGKECLIKANFNCDICGKNGQLHAHHLNGWHWAVSERFDINNLVALCHGCHSYFHSLYGTKNNTKEQYVEFKQFRLNIQDINKVE